MQLSVGEIADIVDGKITGDAIVNIEGVAVFEAAASTDITSIDNARLLKHLNSAGEDK